MDEFPKVNGQGEYIVSDYDKSLVDSIFLTLEDAKAHNTIPRYIDLSDLSDILSNDQLTLIERISTIDPTIYGLKAPYVGIEPVPKDLKRVDAQPFFANGESLMTKPQDLPIPTFNAFTAMAAAMKEDINRPILIADGYRTSPKQALVFLAYLRLYNYDVLQTVKRVAIPGYSEHGTPSNLALDLQNIDGLPSDDNPTDFEYTLEYQWLLEKANYFNFYQSYPKNNSQEMMFEPWHWRFIPSQH